MSDVVMKVNDLLPTLDATLKDADGEYDLTGDTVRFVMRSSGGTVIADQTSTGSNVTILGATSGRVRFTWQSTEVDTPGNFLAEFETLSSDSKRLTFPNAGHIEIVFKPETAS